MRLLGVLALTLTLSACRGDEGPPLRVLVVISGLRSDHTSLCGYRRDTTPTLASLKTTHRATFTCNARAASADPVAALASIVFDASLPEHGLATRPGPDDGAARTALPDLQEGWRSVLVSSSPSWIPALEEPFDDSLVDPTLRRDRFVEATMDTLGRLDQPTLLVVHLADALDPWPAIPDDAPWGSTRGPLDLDAPLDSGLSSRAAWQDAALDADQRRRLLAAMTDHLDEGIRQSDTTLRDLLSALERRRRGLAGARVVVTGDTGYFLGERELLGRVDRLWEPGVRVPILVAEPGGKRVAPLPSSAPLSTRAVGSLLQRGVVPRPTPVPVAHGVDDSVHPAVVMTALWTADGDKLLTHRGLPVRYELGDDADESRARSPFTHEAWPALEALEGPFAAWLSARESR